MSTVTNPVEQFFDLDGSPLDNGYLYFGEPGGNPETQPVQVYWDTLFTIPAIQPIRTMNGYPVRPANSGAPAIIYAVNDVSMTVRNKKKLQVFYSETSGFNNASSNIILRDVDITLTSSDNGKTVIATGTFTQTFDPAAVLGEGWSVTYVNIGTGVITFDPNLTETIDGLATEQLGRNKAMFIYCDGTGFRTTIEDYRSLSVASASNVDLRNIPSNVVFITGNTTINTIQLSDGQAKDIVFTGTPQLVNSASLIVSGSSNYSVSAANETATVLGAPGNVTYFTPTPQQFMLQSISASVNASALTVNYNGGRLDFRNAPITNGTPIRGISVPPLSITVPNGATLGTVNATLSRLIVIVTYNSGNPVLCLVNHAGAIQLDEMNLISPATISGASNANNVIYSASAVIAGNPYRVVGYIEITEAVAGTWATAPSLLQPAGGRALVNLSSLGYNQTRTVPARSVGVNYTNNTNRPFFWNLNIILNPNETVTVNVGGESYSINAFNGATGTQTHPFSTIVLPGEQYGLFGGVIGKWTEVRS